MRNNPDILYTRMKQGSINLYRKQDFHHLSEHQLRSKNPKEQKKTVNVRMLIVKYASFALRGA